MRFSPRKVVEMVALELIGESKGRKSVAKKIHYERGEGFLSGRRFLDAREQRGIFWLAGEGLNDDFLGHGCRLRQLSQGGKRALSLFFCEEEDRLMRKEIDTGGSGCGRRGEDV